MTEKKIVRFSPLRMEDWIRRSALRLSDKTSVQSVELMDCSFAILKSPEWWTSPVWGLVITQSRTLSSGKLAWPSCCRVPIRFIKILLWDMYMSQRLGCNPEANSKMTENADCEKFPCGICLRSGLNHTAPSENQSHFVPNIYQRDHQ